jgi:hypothetical protein
MLTNTRLWKTPWADSAMSMIAGKFILKMGQEEFHGRAADVEVFPRRDADDGGIKRS